MMPHVLQDYKNLTKSDVLRLVMEMWSWLAEDSSRAKYNWPRWIENGGDIPFFENDCATCEYSLQNTHSCSDCILPWRNGHCTEGEHKNWKEAKTDEDKSKAALAIVSLAKRELNKLWNERDKALQCCLDTIRDAKNEDLKENGYTYN